MTVEKNLSCTYFYWYAEGEKKKIGGRDDTNTEAVCILRNYIRAGKNDELPTDIKTNMRGIGNTHNLLSVNFHPLFKHLIRWIYFQCARICVYVGEV